MNRDKAGALYRLMDTGFGNGVEKNFDTLRAAGYDGLCDSLDKLEKNHNCLLKALAARDTSVVSVVNRYTVEKTAMQGAKKGAVKWVPLNRMDKLENLLFQHIFLSGLCKTEYRGRVMNYSSMLMLYRKQPVKKAVKLLPEYELKEGTSEGILGNTVYLTKQSLAKYSLMDIKEKLLTLTEKIGVFFDFVQAVGELHVLELPGMMFTNAPVFLYLMDLAYSFGMTYNEMCCLWGIHVPDQQKQLSVAGQWLYGSGTTFYFAGEDTGWELTKASLGEFTMLTQEDDVHEICSF